MKFKVGDKVKANDEYWASFVSAYGGMWPERFGPYNSHENMIVTEIKDDLIYADNLPWFEDELELIER